MLRQQPQETPSRHHPLVSCEAHGALGEVIHYMIRTRGLEIAMGQLLVPVERGVLELRCLAKNLEMTGIRESALLMKEMNLQSGKTPDELMRSIAYDAPEHDASFPTHVVSRVRTSVGAWCTEGRTTCVAVDA